MISKILVIFGLLCNCFISLTNSYVHHFVFPQFRQFLEEEKAQLSLFELFQRQNIFFNNFQNIENLSKEFPSAKFGVNEFSHLTPEEFRKKYFGNHIYHHRKPATTSSYVSRKKKIKAPETLDYRNSGKVSPIKNQGDCGACWSFIVTAAIESQYLIHKNQLLDLSEQQLVSCVNGNYGCYGGDVITTYQWIQNNGGQIQESLYSFKGKQENCPIFYAQKYPITGYLWASNNEDDIAAFIAEHGPATIAIDMPNFLQHYIGGVIDLDAKSCRKISAGGHGMLLIGYTPEYWIANGDQNGVKMDISDFFQVPPQELLTKDSVTVVVDAVVYYRIRDAIASITNVENASSSTQLLAQTTLRNILGTKTLAELLADREHISELLQSCLLEATTQWGVAVERVEVKDVRIPQSLQRALAAEAEAQREAKAKVIAARGEQEASKALRDAAAIMSETPGALQLRYLQTLNTISAEHNSTIIFPFPIDLVSSFMNMVNPRNQAKAESPPSYHPTSTVQPLLNQQPSLDVPAHTTVQF